MILDKREDVYTLELKNNILTEVTIELTDKCNWRCQHCYISDYSNKGLNKEILFKLFVDLRNMGVFRITFTGGELFTRKDAMEIIRKARSMYFDVYLLTNASLLDEIIIRELAEMHISGISSTIFSMSSSIHDSITQVKGSYKALMSNIKLIQKYNIDFELKSMLIKTNYKEYTEIYNYCKENKFSYRVSTFIHSKHNFNEQPCELMIDHQQLMEIINDVEDIMKYLPRYRSSDHYICTSIHYSCAINAKGDVYPCINMPYVVGNVTENSIKEIWGKSKRLSRIKALRWNDLKECNECNRKEKCYRCSGMAYLESHNLLQRSQMDCNFTNARLGL